MWCSTQLIDPVSLLGAAVIVAAGLVVMARERFRKIPVAAEASAARKRIRAASRQSSTERAQRDRLSITGTS